MGRPKKLDEATLADAATLAAVAGIESSDAVAGIAAATERMGKSAEVLSASLEKLTDAIADGKHGRERAYLLFQRDEKGLLKNVSHVFKDDGSVDWKRMIPDKYIVVNAEYFEKRQIAIPDSTDGLEDKQLLVLLGGIKELAKLRGVMSVDKKVWESSFDRAVVSCKLTFSPNYENDMQPFVYEEVASATLSNTNGFGQLFMETIASNRAFVRAVRNALRIDIVGSDELSGFTSTNNNAETTSESEPWHALRDAAKNFSSTKIPEGFKTFDEFKAVLLEKGTEGADAWTDWKDIPASTIFKLIGLLKKTTKTV